MTSITDLPPAAVKHITQLARGRIIAGVNRYACVCRLWRDAGSSSEGLERLQLLLALADMSEAAMQTAFDWIAQHGMQVQVLVIQAPPAAPLHNLWQSAAALCNLRRLEMAQAHSLELLAPVLGQLPQLQHLMAHVSMARDPVDAEYSELVGGIDALGVFVDSTGDTWQELPDMEQLCPQLVHLQLLVSPTTHKLWLDERLPWLLPARLQQLGLLGVNKYYNTLVPTHLLGHLTALQQLQVHMMDFKTSGDSRGVAAVDQDLAALQQLRVTRCVWPLRDNQALWQLAPKIVEFCIPMFGVDEDELAQLGHLTRLQMEGLAPNLSGAAMAALPLQELVLTESESFYAVAAARAAAGIPSLRSLHLQGGVDRPEELQALSDHLAQCTQLTSLLLVVSSWDAGTMSPFLPVPQQLVGLRQLTVPAELLEQDAGACLAPLTALTRLCLDLQAHLMEWECRLPPAVAQGGDPITALVRQVLQQVQEWPASLQQVVVWVAPGCGNMRDKRTCWEFTPAAGGRFSVWVEEEEGTAAAWARPLRPCRHLPGVWELQGEVRGSS